MGSSYPNKFLPSHWFQAAMRQFKQAQKNSDYESKLPVTFSATHEVQSHCPPYSKSSIDTSQDKLSSAVFENTPTSSRSLDAQSENYFVRSQKFISKKFFQSPTPKENKPYSFSKVLLHTSAQSNHNNDIEATISLNINDSRKLQSNNYEKDLKTESRPSEYKDSVEGKADEVIDVTLEAENESIQSQANCNEDENLPSANLRASGTESASFSNQNNAEYLQKHEKGSPSLRRRSPQQVNERIYRTWLQCHYSKKSHKFSHVVGTCSIMSYNILSQSLLEWNSYLYKNCSRDALPWSFRWSNLKREIESYSIDILCLQEVEEEHYHSEIKPWLDKHYYICSYKRRTGQDKPDGVLTACLSKKYEIVATVPVEYFRSFHRLTNWHNVGLIVVVKMLGKSGQDTPYICVANTHLVYNPNRGDVKLIQLATFLAEIDKVMKEYLIKAGYQLPLVMCGDFNSTPFSPVYDLITSGWLHYGGLSSKHVSGQKTQRGGRDLPDYLLPLDLRINESCTFIQGDERNQPRENHVLRHNLGPLTSSCDRHMANEATTTQDYGITVDYIFYSNTESSFQPQENSEKTDSVESSNPTESNCSISSNTSNPNIENSSSGSMESPTNVNKSNTSNVTSSVKTPLRRFHLKLYKRLSLSSGYSIHRANGLPNKHHSSDHLPVLAKFSITRSPNSSSL